MREKAHTVLDISIFDTYYDIHILYTSERNLKIRGAIESKFNLKNNIFTSLEGKSTDRENGARGNFNVVGRSIQWRGVALAKVGAKAAS